MRKVAEGSVATAADGGWVWAGRAVWAWVVAVLCWVAIMATAVVSLIAFLAVGPDVVVDAGGETAGLLGHTWMGVAAVAATRVAAGVLRRRGGIRREWALVLPGFFHLYPLLFHSSELGLGDVVATAVTMAACTAAVTVWAPSDRRRTGAAL